MSGWSGPGRIGMAVWWRRFVDARHVAAVVAMVVLAGAVFVAMAPRVLEVATVDDLRATLTEATPEERNIRFTSLTEIGAGAPRQPFNNIDYIGGQLRDEHLPGSVQELIADEQWIFDTPQFTVSTYPDQVFARHPPTFRFRHQSDVEERLTLLEGTLPMPRDGEPRLVGPDCPESVDDPAAYEPTPDEQCRFVEYPVFETALTAATASRLGLAIGSEIVELGDRSAAINGRPLVVGDRFMLQPVTSELGFRTSEADLGGARLIVEVSGIIELDPAEDEYWFGDVLLHRPRVRENNDFEFVFAAGLLGADQYRPFRNALPGTGLDFSWRYLVDPSRVEDTDSEAFLTELGQISPNDAELVTRLPELLQEHITQRRLTLQVWSMIGLAFTAAAVAAIATLARAQTVRRGDVDALHESRGASRLQLVAVDLATALTVVVIPTVLGGGVAALAFPQSSANDSVVAASAFAVAGVVAMLGVSVLRSAAPSLRRILFRVAMVVLTVTVIGLLRRRDTDVADATTGDLDPTLMIAPVLVMGVIALIGTDLLGPLAGLASRLVNRRRGAVWFIGLRRIVASTRTVRGPLLAVVMATALSVFATVLGSSIDASQRLAAQQRLGADARIETSLPQIPLPTDLIEEIERRDPDVVFAASLTLQRFDGPRGTFVADVVAIDDRTPSTGDGGPIPVSLVGEWTAPHLPDVGEELELKTGGFVVPMRATDAIDRIPGVRLGRPTIVVDRATFSDATNEQLATPDIALVDDPDAAAALAVMVDGRPGVAMSTQDAILERLTGDPLSTWTSRGVRLAALGGLALALVASAAATVVHAADRRRDLGLITILGGRRSDTVRMALAELTPIHIAATVLGVIAGVVASRALEANLSLEAFADGAVSAGVVVDWVAVTAVVVAIAVVLALTIAGAARSIRRLDHAMMLREGNR